MFHSLILLMEVSIDKYGRIVIPKPLRDQLGLEAGTELRLEIESSDEDCGDMLTLRPIGTTSPLRREGSVLVHTGSTEEPLDPVESVRRARTDRTRTGASSLSIDDE